MNPQTAKTASRANRQLSIPGGSMRYMMGLGALGGARGPITFVGRSDSTRILRFGARRIWPRNGNEYQTPYRRAVHGKIGSVG